MELSLNVSLMKSCLKVYNYVIHANNFVKYMISTLSTSINNMYVYIYIYMYKIYKI
jgi:hypothetical protein